MADLASLFGHKEHVHFDRVELDGAVFVQHVEGGHHDLIREHLRRSAWTASSPTWKPRPVRRGSFGRI